MSIPILPLYIIGLMLFIFGIEGNEKKEYSLIYLGLAFFSSLMGYYLSYSDANYLQAAYFPLVIAIFSIVMLIYTAWQLIPHELSWDEKAKQEDD